MNDPMTILKQDHREAKAMLKELAESSPGRTRVATLRKLEQALTLHMEIEETLLYPLVRSEEGDEKAEGAENEHTLARDGLAKANQMVAVPGFGAVIAMLLGGIEHHVREEEKEILPELKKRLDREAWLALGDQIVRAKKQGARRNGTHAKATAGAR